MIFRSVIDFVVEVRGKLRFGGIFVSILEEQVGNVAIHG